MSSYNGIKVAGALGSFKDERLFTERAFEALEGVEVRWMQVPERILETSPSPDRVLELVFGNLDVQETVIGPLESVDAWGRGISHGDIFPPDQASAWPG